MKMILAFASVLALFGGAAEARSGLSSLSDRPGLGSQEQERFEAGVNRAIVQAAVALEQALRQEGGTYREPLEQEGGTFRSTELHAPLERIPLVDDVVQYRFRMRIGPGEHDVIRLHRIVRERAPWRPVRARRGVIMAHGDAWGFEATFMASLATDAIGDEQNLAVFLAANGLDVWGVDFRWTLVPADTADLSFMADWGLDTNLADFEAATTVARFVRLATGSGFSQLQMLAFSSGGQVGWSLLGKEAVRPFRARNIRAYVAVDHHYKTADEAVRQGGCDAAASARDQIDAGTFSTDFAIIRDIGDLAQSAPDDPSPLFSLLSNADLAEFIGADPAGGAIPALHSVGGIVDPDTLETELLHARPEHWFAFLSSVSTYQPLGINRDGGDLLCDEIDSPFDDHLDQVTVPIFYIGSVGGFGAFGLHTTTLVASTDVTSTLIDVTADPVRGYGHNDLFLADDAQAIVWQPILDWLETH